MFLSIHGYSMAFPYILWYSWFFSVLLLDLLHYILNIPSLIPWLCPLNPQYLHSVPWPPPLYPQYPYFHSLTSSTLYSISSVMCLDILHFILNIPSFIHWHPSLYPHYLLDLPHYILQHLRWLSPASSTRFLHILSNIPWSPLSYSPIFPVIFSSLLNYIFSISWVLIHGLRWDIPE